MEEKMGDKVSVDQMFQFFQQGAVGTKEFRSWLAKVDPLFAGVRDPDVDNEIDSIARRRRELIESDQPVIIDREGLIKEQ